MAEDVRGKTMNFRSDNVATVSQPILDALLAANLGPAASYGDDAHSHALNRIFSDLFETEGSSRHPGVSPLPNARSGGYRAFVTAKMAVHRGESPLSMSGDAATR
jgi:hypothetical protein